VPIASAPLRPLGPLRSLRSASAARAAPTLIAFAVVAAPTATLLLLAVRPRAFALLGHLIATVAPGQATQGAIAAIAATLLALALAAGGLAAALFEFPGRRWLDRLLLLPLLVPTWYLACLYRERFDARGVIWLALVLAIGAAPLWHLLGGVALRAIPGAYLDVLRLGGRSGGGALRHVLPLAAPALGAAAVLGAILAWSDAPSARALAVPTLAVGALDQWSAREDAAAGALLGLSIATAAVIAASAVLARLARASWMDEAPLALSPARRPRLRGARAALPWLLAAPQLALGVIVPAATIGRWSIERLERVDLSTLASDAARTLLLATAATALAIAIAAPIVRATASGPAWRGVAATAVALLPFALPVTLLAAAVTWAIPGGQREGLAARLHASLVPLAVAMGVRLAGLFVGAGRAALLRSGRDHVATARLLGHDGLVDFVALLRPVLARPAFACAVFGFLECLKDVHLTVALAPFGFESISSRVFQLALTDRTADCAPWMLCLALIGLWPLMTLARLADGDATDDAGHASDADGAHEAPC
jgi:iron(III) transport system permease protein